MTNFLVFGETPPPSTKATNVAHTCTHYISSHWLTPAVSRARTCPRVVDDLSWRRRRFEVYAPDIISYDVSDEDEAGCLVDGNADGVREVQTRSEIRQVVCVGVERHDVRHASEGDEYAYVARLFICAQGQRHIGVRSKIHWRKIWLRLDE